MAFFSDWGRPPNLGVVRGPIFEDFGTGPGAAPPRSKIAQPGPTPFGPNYRGWSPLTIFTSRGHCPQNSFPHNPGELHNDIDNTAQRDGRPAEYRWRPLFNAAVWLTPIRRVACSNAAKTRNTLKFAGVPQTNETISASSGPKFTIL